MNKNNITILSIETTCDDTAIAIVNYNDGNFKVLSNLISSQIKEHNSFGGVVPELASRFHIQNIIPVLDKVVSESRIVLSDVDYIAITTKGGGLIGSITVGVETAKTLSLLLNKPIISVNHIRGHSLASFFDFENNKINEVHFPILSLTISGGHTQLILIKDFNSWEIVGQTIDDAAGECFDKISKILNLGYPGGPIISKLAELGDENFIELPRPMIGSGNLDFSFSGLKTAVLYNLQDMGYDIKNFREIKKINEDDFEILKNNKELCNICASFQKSVIDVLTKKSLKAIEQYNPKSFILAGGVAANKKLRETLKEKVEKTNTEFLMPTIPLCMDNALMINIAAYFNVQNNIDVYSFDEIKIDINRKA